MISAHLNAIHKQKADTIKSNKPLYRISYGQHVYLTYRWVLWPKTYLRERRTYATDFISNKDTRMRNRISPWGKPLSEYLSNCYITKSSWA